MKILCGSASEALTDGICSRLEVPRSKARVGRFSDGEVKVQIGENVRGSDVFIVNST
ncbi:MAG: ribose-phosphate pyrophosphokinase-like domain-containing protein, partial [Candidatus Hydrogenedentes bacterium]|nr:ribose-phosphate pyrophosphokinase-like domain-containing protein [Candidatus Hydrogenedentota bacterium]